MAWKDTTRSCRKHRSRLSSPTSWALLLWMHLAHRTWQKQRWGSFAPLDIQGDLSLGVGRDGVYQLSWACAISCQSSQTCAHIRTQHSWELDVQTLPDQDFCEVCHMWCAPMLCAWQRLLQSLACCQQQITSIQIVNSVQCCLLSLFMFIYFLSRKWVQCPLQVGHEILPQVEEFKYLGFLFTSEGRMEREIDSRIGVASAVLRALHRHVIVKKELSQK